MDSGIPCSPAPIQIGVEIFDTQPPPPPKPTSVIPDKLLRIMRKYKYNWRVDQLSRPKYVTFKFLPKYTGLLKPTKPRHVKLSAETKFYSDQMSRPPLRWLVPNKANYCKFNKKSYRTAITKNIRRAWDSIYNFYKKQQREKLERQMKRDASRFPKKKKKIDLKRYDVLAKPKPVFQPPASTEPKKIFEDFERLDTLATPKPDPSPPPKPLGVPPAALTYEPTENVIKLAQPPGRYKNIPPPVDPTIVKKSALRYKITPRLTELAEPKKKVDKQKVDDEFDPFAISKNALKYRPTARIIELAKPLERE